jgi:hypothetical protein
MNINYLNNCYLYFILKSTNNDIRKKPWLRQFMWDACTLTQNSTLYFFNK